MSYLPILLLMVVAIVVGVVIYAIGGIEHLVSYLASFIVGSLVIAILQGASRRRAR